MKTWILITTKTLKNINCAISRIRQTLKITIKTLISSLTKPHFKTPKCINPFANKVNNASTPIQFMRKTPNIQLARLPDDESVFAFSDQDFDRRVRPDNILWGYVWAGVALFGKIYFAFPKADFGKIFARAETAFEIQTSRWELVVLNTPRVYDTAFEIRFSCLEYDLKTHRIYDIAFGIRITLLITCSESSRNMRYCIWNSNYLLIIYSENS